MLKLRTKRCRPVWYNYETKEYETYFYSDVPMYYNVTFKGMSKKVISMAGYMKMDGYINLDEPEFKKY